MIKRYLEFIKEDINTPEPNTKKLSEINSMIDYTLLEEGATDEEIIELCKKADRLQVKSVCVLPKMVSLAKECLKDSQVLVCTVISFPQGSNSVEEKVSETKSAISNGADEIDMVLNYHLLTDQNEENDDTLYNEVSSLAHICHDSKNKMGGSVILKVIVESGLLTEEQTKLATKICLKSGADFIKTSTGKVPVGAELNKIKVMYNTIKESGKSMKIKASGGVRDMNQITQFEPYVDRFGMGFGSVDKINNLTPNVEVSGY
jgi:deoxyribose-phosphate aldolase